MAKIGRGSEQAMIRLPDGMRDRIASIARENGRSMNAEIVQALELFFPAETDSNEVKITLSLPAKLRDELETQAIYKARSLHDEIVRLLQVFAAGNLAEDDFGALVKRLEDSVAASQRLTKELKEGVEDISIISRWDTHWIEFFIEQFAAENGLTRTEAVLEILKKWFTDHGYLKKAPD